MVRRIPPLLVDCLLVGAIALTTAVVWLTLTDARVLSPGAVIVCTIVSVAAALGVEAAIHRLRHGRPRRAHARTGPSSPCAASANQPTTRKDTST